MSVKIDPSSLRGRLSVAFANVIASTKSNPDMISAGAARAKLTPDQMLAAILTEAALEIFEAHP